jgi:serine/threonine protein kinase
MKAFLEQRKHFADKKGKKPLPAPCRLNSHSVKSAFPVVNWNQLTNFKFFAEGGRNVLYSARYDGKPVVVKMVKPKFISMHEAIAELETELEIHAMIKHDSIVELVGAGLTPDGHRFIIIEKIGDTLSRLFICGSKSPLFFNIKIKKKNVYVEVLRHAQSLACALDYCHARVVPGSMVLHRDIKPDNIAFTSDGRLKLLDFGLAKTVESTSLDTVDGYHMSKAGSYRYMSPEVGLAQPYNHKADVYSFGKKITYAFTARQLSLRVSLFHQHFTCKKGSYSGLCHLKINLLKAWVI